MNNTANSILHELIQSLVVGAVLGVFVGCATVLIYVITKPILVEVLCK